MPETPVEINACLVSDLIADQFPQWAQLPVNPVEFDGWDNRTFHLGEEMCVRLPSAEGYVAQVKKEQHWLPRLAPLLPLPIPAPVAMGIPVREYPWHWSVYRWLDGENAMVARIDDPNQFALTLAQFLTALQSIDTSEGPPPGKHNFYRGGPLTTYDTETHNAIAALNDEIDTNAATALWEAALQATWHGPPVWLHGDMSSSNLLVMNGQLSAIMDFGCSGVGDPSCDLTIAWTFFSGESRETFRRSLVMDEATWARSRGWALWKALITLAGHVNTNPQKTNEARRVIEDVLRDHEIE